MADARRAPGVVTVVGILFLAGSLSATAWWFNRAGPPPANPIPPDELDVYCSGRVDAAGQVVALEPSTAGRVMEVAVAEGDQVAADQPLLKLDSSLAETRFLQAQATLEAIDLERVQAEQALERFPTQVEGRAAVAAAAAARAEAARQALEQRKVQAQSTGPLGAAELAAAEAEIRALDDLAAGERAGVADFRKMQGELNLRVRLIEVRRRSAEAERGAAEKAVRECVLRAPVAGTILRLQATPGGLVSPGTMTPAVIFAPAGPYVVRAEIDQEALGRVREGMTAEVRDENRPTGPMWPGRVRSVAGWVAQRRTMVLEPGEISDVRTVECVIDLVPGGDRLWIGQRMRVRIVRGSEPGPGADASLGR